METDPNSTGSRCIDGDVWPEIFMRLPAKSLCRFRCVCKSWESVISSSLMINLHHSFTNSSTPAHLKPYLLRLAPGKGSCRINSYALCRPTSAAAVQHEAVRFPFRDILAKCCTLVDVVEGVVCISYTWSFDSIILWNPAIQKYVPLPVLPYPLDTAYGGPGCTVYSAIGFGYDRSKSDFKVVRIWIRLYDDDDDTDTDDDDYDDDNALYRSPLQSMYEVYSAREGVWRIGVADINFKTRHYCNYNDIANRTSIFLNGKIHWLLYKYVLMFDCECEEFTTMEIPQQVYEGRLQLLEYSGMLSAAMYSSELSCSNPSDDIQTSFWGPVRPSIQCFDRIEYFIELWAMEEHGWKRYRIPDPFKMELKHRGYTPSLGERLFPYGPHEWLKFLSLHRAYSNKLVSGHVYEETLLLMDLPRAQSYTVNEIVRICSKGEMETKQAAFASSSS